MNRFPISLLLFFTCLILPPGALADGPLPVTLVQIDRGWELLRAGQPYSIRGAGGTASLELLAAAGANSIRTWGADDIDALLDEAHALGLSVSVGIWLGHERHGFDYSDPVQVAEQFERAREVVLRYKDHPAVLLWGVGNEMEGFGAGDDPAIWTAVNDIAAMIKEVDPYHPTMTVTAEIGGERIAMLNKYCPAIDIHGINSYGGAPSLPARYRAAGATRPFILTEFGPPGAWEVAKTPWGAPLEPASSRKAEYYRQSYLLANVSEAGLSLGSYVFNWGFKMEATATWFGMFLPDGSALAAVDVMTELWSGRAPGNVAPVIEPLTIDGESQVKPGAKVQLRTRITDPEGNLRAIEWALRRESDEHVTGGDFRAMLPDIEGAVIESGASGALIRMPKEPGPYRLFVYARDAEGKAATANIPLLVIGKVRTAMPVVLYEDGLQGMPWAPSGWMGSTGSLTIDGEHRDNPQSGDACLRMRYEGEGEWVAVAWQNPPNNWGEQEGGFDLGGARHLELWARGEYGGEKIEIGVGILGADALHPDSGISRRESFVLSDDWKRYRLSLRKLDLSSIKTGLVLTLYGRATPVTVYLDRIRFVR